ncbi:MAG: mannitol dehydrogenase family protein [Sphaerochaetaceae bacterium]|jgi:fructuronate reductase
MKLNDTGLADKQPWMKNGYRLPSFDRGKVALATKQAPIWIHFGAGNIFRGFPAALQQSLLEQGLSDKGIVVGEGFDYEIIDKIYAPHDDLSLLVVLKSDGSIEKRVIASVVEALKCDPSFVDEWKAFQIAFANPSLQMVSFTITEKGYSLRNADGVFFPSVEADFASGPQHPAMFLSKLTALVYGRYLSGASPLALVSMDNCSHNGEKLQTAVLTIARQWAQRDLVDQGFVDYLSDPSKVGFPWSMIDKITPRPDEKVRASLEADGFEDTRIVVTDKKTWIAPFVNAEEPQYLVIEDLFPNGRPPLEKAGVYFTDRDTVNKVEKMKVCTCLNPLHTCLAIYGCLLGYTLIADEMRDPQLSKMVDRIGYAEGLPVVVDPGILDPKAFIKEVLEVRFPNPFMPDTPQRIACDTSQKLSIRYGETIKAYLASKTLDVSSLKLIPLVFAGWCRYLMGVDDNGGTFELSPDPLLSHVCPYVASVRLGDAGPFDETLRPILSDAKIFGVDLYEAKLAPLVVSYFTELVAGPGAVRRTLEKYVG